MARQVYLPLVQVAGAAILCFALLFVVLRPSYAAGVIYVNVNATGANDGSSWANAYTSLQNALRQAKPGDEIWVAAGAYKPTTDTNRTVAFVLKDGVAIYGGFAGTETQREQRNWSAHPTILSGDIGETDVITDNSFHVVVGDRTKPNALLDGFTIRGGNAKGDTTTVESGGGLYSMMGSPTLRNLIFSANLANAGGGMFIFSSNATLSNITFTLNTAVVGGGFSAGQSTPTLLHVAFFSNSASALGGGIAIYRNSNVALNHAIFNGNTANSGGGLYNDSCKVTLANVIFSNNTALNVGGGLFNYNSKPTVSNALFTGNSGYIAGAMYNVQANPVLRNVTIAANSARISGSAFYNSSSQPSLYNSILWGNGRSSIITDETSVMHINHSIVEEGVYTGTGNLSVDPRFVDASQSQFQLQAGSPAIDVGDNKAVSTTVDLADLPRIEDGNGDGVAQVDLGAYEWQPPDAHPTAPTTPLSTATSAAVTTTVTGTVAITATASPTVTPTPSLRPTLTSTPTSTGSSVPATVLPGVTTTARPTISSTRPLTPTGTSSDATATVLPATTATPAPTATPVATPNATTTPSQAACQELLVNGGFEVRDGWFRPGTPLRAFYTTERAAVSANSLHMGAADNTRRPGYSTGYQWIALPREANRITLHAQVWRSSTSRHWDLQYAWVTVRHGRIHKIFQSRINNQQWDTVTYDLTPFRGKTVQILFGVYNKGFGSKTVMYADDVSVQSCR